MASGYISEHSATLPVLAWYVIDDSMIYLPCLLQHEAEGSVGLDWGD